MRIVDEELVNFLVKKTKHGKKVLSVSDLAKKFKKFKKFNSKIPWLHTECFESSIKRFLRNVHLSFHLDTETKVKIIFGLSAPVTFGFLRKLEEEAEVTVDDFNRITHYKRKGGGLELQGEHPPQPNIAKVSNTEILEFLAKKVEETDGILAIDILTKQFKAEMGKPQNITHLELRIRQAMKQIYESEMFDEEMKVRMIFATRTRIEKYALKELQENADVVISRNNMIMIYQKKDGSLYLNRNECKIKCGNEKNTIDESDDVKDSDEKVDEEEDLEDDEESSDDSEEEEAAMDVTTRSGRISKKRFSGANKKRKISEYMNGSVGKKKKGTQERAPVEEYDNDYSIDFSNQPNDEQRVKLEPFNGPLKMDLSLGAVIDDGDDFIEEIPAPTENFMAPKNEEIFMDVKMEEEPDVIILDDQIDKEIKLEQSSEDMQTDHTPLTTILESFHGFIDILDLPILSNLQKEIEAKLKECKGNSKKVSNEEIYHYLELCLLKVNKNWNSKESVEPFSLESFISHFKHAVVHMKCPSLINFQKKLKKIIGELRVQNKLVPVTAIRNALQSVVDNIINY